MLQSCSCLSKYQFSPRHVIHWAGRGEKGLFRIEGFPDTSWNLK